MSKSVYETLGGVDVNPLLEKKGKFSYLSWSDCVDTLLHYYPSATWEVTKWDGHPYLKAEAGCFVEVSVTVEGVTRSQIHPILNHTNKTIVTPNAFDVNTSIQRCLAKAIALHGLGLYVFRGEDLPPDTRPIKEPRIGQVSGDPVDEIKITKATAYIIKTIDADIEEEKRTELLKAVSAKLTNDEILFIYEGLHGKAIDSKRKYKTIFEDYINDKEKDQCQE